MIFLKKLFKNQLFIRIFKFSIVGAIGFSIDSSLFWVQTILIRDKAYLRLAAPIFSFEIAVLVNYMFYHHWVWRDRRKETIREYWKGFFHYNLTAAGGLLINVGLLNLLIAVFAFFRPIDHYIFAKMSGAVFAAVFNFIMVQNVVFKEKDKS